MSAPATTDPVHTLYVDHGKWLHGWLRRRLGDSHQAADLAQDTFVRVITGRQAQAILEPRAYLTTLAQRVLYNFWRRRELEQAWLDALAQQPPALAPSAEDYALVCEAIHTLDLWLGGLPPKVRQALLLRQLDGLSHSDIATHLGVSLSTAERYQKQALLHLCTLPEPLW
ncbi:MULTISPECIES: sigma-70 family RNA polymerase sigma factor [Comamonas]|jgi:RNA polymerase sigma-70 factor (ECF subfamily)|uniref:RNA polymerase subunit sigma n=1 Tax=Comamonas terrigena TaxID=32013 RepID=A0A2A7UTT0_COMTR|nr:MULTISPECIES: sigma-70 family RNA polymerase sigma factor [Comamonas]MBD9532409.1 sigma-70 family RNA polymerase sigma factor [Comamonas sp. CMM01]MDH0048302.1 sigma-70 family RNA polymerase sigma factor [Comamonas terrigena]MDH0510710.1 sigma-70 family RNA polymerase sigma factor [Comamonas terrigena]MDH1090383.1 sigma-70 family RNA polymerase sigma factor [Comamonas terrigena]MDH1290725.1 sigma-70 family RNA polymerase sigma factor [Comamonas terrigena]